MFRIYCFHADILQSVVSSVDFLSLGWTDYNEGVVDFLLMIHNAREEAVLITCVVRCLCLCPHADRQTGDLSSGDLSSGRGMDGAQLSGETVESLRASQRDHMRGTGNVHLVLVWVSTSMFTCACVCVEVCISSRPIFYFLAWLLVKTGSYDWLPHGLHEN